MITFFSVPKPFTDPHIALIQRNALRSWLLQPGCEVVLYGDDPGVAEAAAELGFDHVPEIERTEYGTPLLSSVFDHVQVTARNRLVCYLNADIILLPGFADLAYVIRAPRFLATGRRWNLRVTAPVDLAAAGWAERLWAEAHRRGWLHPETGMDYFLFPKGSFPAFPRFVVGRPGWDNWLVFRARQLGLTVVDATRAARIVHQEHDYRHVPGGRDPASWHGPEADLNYQLIGDLGHTFTIYDATHALYRRLLLPALEPPYLRSRLGATAALHRRFGHALGVLRSVRVLLRRAGARVRALVAPDRPG